jgi:hypothetical protein
MTLNYLEFHVVDHCNLNCKGCAHFCPLVANDELANFSVFKKDMNRLSEIYIHIQTINILGGEPLLNPDLTDFLDYSRIVFPKSNIFLTTNGILLDKQNNYFWDTCKKNNISINLSYYPVKINIEKISSLCKVYGLDLNISMYKKEFVKLINIKGDSNPDKSFKNCKRMVDCPILKDGHIYSCAYSYLYKYFNNFFDEKIITEDADNGIDIYSHNALEIKHFLNNPVSICKYCITKKPKFKWGFSERDINEWIGEDDNSFRHYCLLNKYIAYNLIKDLWIFRSKIYRSFREVLIRSKQRGS